jgi:hypothetical protein
MRIAPVAAGLALALSLAAPALAEEATLANGRVFSAPTAFKGCGPASPTTAANGSRSFTYECTLTVDGKPAKATIAYSLLTPNDTAPRAFVEVIMTKMNRAAMIGDPRMGVQGKTLKTAGKPGAFLCWVYDDVPTLTGGAVCALEEPSIRVAIFVSASDAYTAMRVLEQAAAQTTLR